jgi:NDP-sugar pyrophosphorylase family protein
MIDRLIRIFIKAGAEKVVIINNDIHPQTKYHIQQLIGNNMPVELHVKTTPSSMHSFYELMPYLGKKKFCLTTVDTIFRENEFYRFIDDFKTTEFDGMMAATDFIDDEKPLYIATDNQLIITGFYDSIEHFNCDNHINHAQSVCNLISGGIYCLDSKAFNTLERCMKSGMSRMRNFQRQLIVDGLKLKAYKFSKILDVDHADDIKKAEEFLK